MLEHQNHRKIDLLTFRQYLLVLFLQVVRVWSIEFRFCMHGYGKASFHLFQSYDAELTMTSHTTQLSKRLTNAEESNKKLHTRIEQLEVELQVSTEPVTLLTAIVTFALDYCHRYFCGTLFAIQ